MQIDPKTTVGDLVAERPGRSRVFETFGIDYCCGGQRPLEEAVREKGLDVADVIARLQADIAEASAPTEDPSAMSLTELCDHIEAKHHAYLRAALPRLEKLSEKVAKAHGAHVPWVLELRQVFLGLYDELDAHMMKEEQVLFPIIRQVEQGYTGAAGHCGGIQNPIRVMLMEHDNAGDALASMSELSGGYTPPAEACNTFRALLDGLRELELDLHTHIHKENNILFPRAMEAAERVA